MDREQQKGEGIKGSRGAAAAARVVEIDRDPKLRALCAVCNGVVVSV